MSKGRLWNERTKVMLTMELAVMLPAAALIGFSIWKLRSIQRDKAVDAAIQRDFSHMLKIAEKRIDGRMNDKVSEVRKSFPCPTADTANDLDKILERHPEIAHVFIYDSQAGLIFRSQPRRAHALPKEQDNYAFSDVEINVRTYQVHRKGKLVDFSAKEFELLKYFLCHPGETLSRDRLLEDVWGYEHFPTTRTVDAHIVHLRQKLEPNPEEPRYILTVHGVGYKFVG